MIGRSSPSATFLPVDDPDPAGRARELARRRSACPWSHTRLPGVGMPARIGKDDRPGAGFFAICLYNEARFHLNTRICRLLGVPLSGRPRSVRDYARAFQILPLPEAVSRIADDTTFAWFRVAGVNPMVVERFRAERDHGIQVDARIVSDHPAFAGDRWSSLVDAGRAYVVDFGCMAAARNGRHDGIKQVVAPVGLFGVTRSGQLEPLAIQVERGSSRRLLTPRDGWAWRMARTTLDSADVNHQQPMAHGFAHVLCGTIATAAKRQLSPRHPIARLLAPHAEGTVYINEMAVDRLLSFGTSVDDMMTGPIPAIHDLVAQNLLNRPVVDRCFPRDLALRGVDDPVALPQYPYRDDALDLWNTIAAWVGEYVELYYPTDTSVAADGEIAAWAADLIAVDGGRLRGIGPDNAIGTRDALTQLLTVFVFNGSVQHAATNFPQGPIMSFAPAAPMAVWRQVPEDPAGVTEQDWLDMLPSLERAYQQVELGYRLYATLYTRLGVYRADAFDDPRVPSLLRLFQARLEQIERRIHTRNQTRYQPYDYLLPSRVPQSVNI